VGVRSDLLLVLDVLLTDNPALAPSSFQNKHPPATATASTGAVDLVRACRAAGLKTAVGSSAEQVKVRTAGAYTHPSWICNLQVEQRLCSQTRNLCTQLGLQNNLGLVLHLSTAPVMCTILLCADTVASSANQPDLSKRCVQLA
jgi:hypothetical protein